MSEPGARALRTAPRSRWLTSWRSALRLAWRDARAHRGGSLLIMAMIGLPVLIICSGAAMLATMDVTTRESLPASVGAAQALISTHRGTVEQAVDGEVITESDRAARSTVPGHQPGQPWTTDQLERLTGGRVGVSDTADTMISWPGGSVRSVVRVIGREVLGPSGLVDLVEGRLPEAAGEVLVTESGLAAGLPQTGHLDGTVGNREVAAEIVGVVRATGPSFEPVSLVVGEEWLGTPDGAGFLVVRDTPVSWTDVLAWNEAGVSVISPTVLADPPLDAPRAAGTGRANTALVVLVALGLVLETALLAGPAFAVSAARRRRALALIASNGADRGQVARFMMAQGVVLGTLAVTIGAGLGTVLGWVWVRGFASILDPSLASSIGRPPLDTYPWSMAMIMTAALAAAGISAFVPGRRVTGLGIAPALAGRAEGRRPAGGLPVAGAVTMAVGALLVALSLVFRGSYTSLVGAGLGGGLLIIGALFLIPSALQRIGGWTARAPVIVRIGVRDAARGRARSAPAVGATAVAVAVLTMITISSMSDDAQSRRDYLPSTLPGAAVVDAYGSERPTIETVRVQQPTWTVEPAGLVGRDGPGEQILRASAVPTGCTPQQAIAPVDEAAQPPDRCQAFAIDTGWGITVAATNTLNPAALGSDQRTALDHGALLVTSPDLVHDGHVRLAVASSGADPTTPGTLLRTTEVPAIAITSDQYETLDYLQRGSASQNGAILTAAGAERAGLPWTVYRYEIVDPTGPISRADEQAINDRVVVPLTVERGYQSASQLITVVLLGIAVTLVLVGSLIPTALTQLETRTVSTTLAALGVTRGFRRGVAVAQATLIAILGSVAGVALGLAPGLGLAATLTTDQDPGTLLPVFVVPYGELAAMIVVVTLLAAALAWFMVPRHLEMTRRST